MNTGRLIDGIKQQEKRVADILAKYEKRKAQVEDGVFTCDEFADMLFYEKTYLAAMKYALRLVQEED